MPDLPPSQLASSGASHGAPSGNSSGDSLTSFRALWFVLLRRRRFVGATIGGLLAACLTYCLIVPNEYEASARIALRAASATALNLDASSDANPGASSSSQAQLETLADVFRSNQLAWAVILNLKLYAARGFAGNRFAHRFPQFCADVPDPETQSWLIERFQRRLNVRTIPRTLIVQIRFWSHDPALSAAVVNGMIRTYNQKQSASRSAATTDATTLLNNQLNALRSSLAAQDKRLLQFQQRHGLLDTPATLANGQIGETEHAAAIAQIDDLTKELSAAVAERILREAEYRAAQRGSPELIIASDPHLQGQGAFATALLQQLHARRSDLQQEQSQLAAEHGPNFPRVVEIRVQLQDIDNQIAAEDQKLVARFHEAFQTAADREQLLRRSLAQMTSEGMKLNAAATEYAAMRQEANASRGLYTRLTEKAQEALLTAGLASPDIAVIDPAMQPAKPSAPNLPVYLAITLFIAVWTAVLGALMLESLTRSNRQTSAVLLMALLVFSHPLCGQAPTPSTSGLPTGVARIPQSADDKVQPNAKDAPAVWGSAQTPGSSTIANATDASGSTVAAPLAPGDVISVSEIHTPEFHTTARISATGTIALPLIDEVQINNLDESAAAHTIESALIKAGMLLHPQVLVTVLSYAGQDVSVLGEVVRPGVYPYAAHHRLLDLISAASGLAPGAGSLVTVTHRDSTQPLVAVTLNAPSDDVGVAANPELASGDTVQVSRAGLVYVIGDVTRPGGFPVDPSENLTFLQALTLAWGPTQNASLTKALLIREEKGGRTVTTLNLKRLLRGQDPDLPIRDRDIIFVPDSAAKNLWNRTMESVVQSAAGVSIYAGLVYSQRF